MFASYEQSEIGTEENVGRDNEYTLRPKLSTSQLPTSEFIIIIFVIIIIIIILITHNII